MDICFVLDSSYSLTQEDWNKELLLAARIISRLNVDSVDKVGANVFRLG